MWGPPTGAVTGSFYRFIQPAYRFIQAAYSFIQPAYRFIQAAYERIWKLEQKTQLSRRILLFYFIILVQT